MSLPTYLAMGARLGWVLDLTTHFCVYYVLLLLPAILLCFRRCQWIFLGIASLALAINLAMMVLLYQKPTTTAQSGAPLRVFSANVYTRNSHFKKLLGEVRAADPDIVLLLEFSDRWAKNVRELESAYPHSISRPRNDSSGIAFFSRLPVETLEIVEMGAASIPSVLAVVKHDQRTFTLLGTHPPPPMDSRRAQTRNDLLDTLAQQVAAVSGPVLVVGDLNTTPWSPYFQDLLLRGNLQNSQQGYGVQPSWFAGMGLIRLPIDHVLHTSDFMVLDRRVGGDLGSDHRPVVVDLVLKKLTR